jgi:hypothetical protein
VRVDLFLDFVFVWFCLNVLRFVFPFVRRLAGGWLVGWFIAVLFFVYLGPTWYLGFLRYLSGLLFVSFGIGTSL